MRHRPADRLCRGKFGFQKNPVMRRCYSREKKICTLPLSIGHIGTAGVQGGKEGPVFFFSDFAFGSGGNQSFLFSPVAWKLPARFEAAERRRGGGGGAKAKIFGVLSSQSVADVVSNEEKKIGVERRLCPSAEDGDNRRVASEYQVHFSQHKYSIFARRTRLHGKDLLQDVSSFFVVAKRGHILYDIKPDRYCMHPTVFLIVPTK